jgi:hypothetical protein
MNRIFLQQASSPPGLAAVVWVGIGFVGASAPALLMTAVIAGVYGLGAFELHRYRAATASLAAALAQVPQPLADLGAWLAGVHPSLQATPCASASTASARPARPGVDPLPGRPAGDAGHAGHLPGHGGDLQGRGVRAGGLDRPAGDPRGAGRADQGPGAGLRHLGGRRGGTSAMLGLLSALCRRERMQVAQALDARMANSLRPFSLAHQRQETYRALQVQATALPEVVSGLQALMDGMERRNQQLNAQLLASQALFHREASVAYTGLADSVGQSLKDSLSVSARIAGESLKPVVEAAMREVAQESKRLHERVSEATQAQLNGLSATFGATAATVSDTWTVALQTHARASEAQALALERALGAFTLGFDQRATALLATIQEGATRSATDQAAADRQRLHAWTQSLETLAATQQAQWERAGAMTLARQQAVIETLEQTAGAISEQASEHARQTLADMARLLAQSDELVRARIDAESKWTQQHGERLDQLAGLLRTELGALRDDEATRGNAAVERLGELQSALSTHLATLGAALEAPMTRLMQTAAEVPQAAAGVLTQLREEMSQITERDTLALQERALVMDRINALLQTLNQTSGEQRAAIESLATAAAAVMDQASRQFADTLGAQAGRSEAVAAQVAGSAVELASLGESFNHGVALFSASNQKLMDSLQRIDDTLGRSVARSDEQLAYYVAQAREVIDLSISAQQGVIEDLRRLRNRQSAPAERVAEGVAG